MFENLRNALEIAETVERCLKYEKESCIAFPNELNSRMELDLINDIEKLIQKWVKNQM